MRFATACQLADALRCHRAGAREQLVELCSRLVEPLLKRLQQATPRRRPQDPLVQHTLRWIEIFVITRDSTELARFDGRKTDWREFRAYLLLNAVRLLHWNDEEGASDDRRSSSRKSDAPAGNPIRRHAVDHCGYTFQMLCKPKAEVPGDLAAEFPLSDRLRVVVADAMGKSWPAYLVVQGMALLWAGLAGQTDRGPREILDELDRDLLALLPEGVFIEATVADFCDRGQACVCAAGGGVLLLRLATGLPVKWQQLSGRLLGIEYPDPEPRVEHCWMLQPGAEVLIASDGLFDQEVGPQRLGDTIRESLEQSPGWHCVHGHVVQLLDRTLATNEQFDDVTVVTICNHTNA